MFYSVRVSSTKGMVYSRDNPFPAKLKSRVRISGTGSEKNVQHLVFDIAGSDMVYKCGDSIAVLPKNSIVDVAEILDLLKIQPDTAVEIPGARKRISIFSALYEHFCITNLPRKFLEWFAATMTDSDEISHMDGRILCADDECKIAAKLHSLLEMLKKFRALRRVDAQEIVANLNKLMPRLYSIASSPLANSNEVHIVVNVVSYVNFIGNTRHGIASTYLANDMNIGADTANVFIVSSMFAMPTDVSAKIIMIGPGTGVAPFRGFLQERQCLEHRGERIGSSWLFFGDRNYETDFFFRDEFLNFKDSGILTNLHLAFSRDQEKKIYVQDRMWENREELWSWILDDAYIYVCGNASNMAVDVGNVLKKIAMEVGNFDEARAGEFFKSLRRSRHYQMDVY
jgi:sulfite reductase (NADPH) flavoprotein alpha-component